MADFDPWSDHRPSRTQLRQPVPSVAGVWIDTEAWRYFQVDGLTFPVLLRSCLKKADYVEAVDPPGPDDDVHWYGKFERALIQVGKAVFVWDHPTPQDWAPDGIYKVSGVHCGNFLTCTVGKRLARVKEK